MADHKTCSRPEMPSTIHPLNGRWLASKEIIFFLAPTAILSTILVSFGRLGWPGLHWDASLYGTPVLNVANGKGWVFSSYTLALVNRADTVFNFHGVLHVILYGSILQAKTWGQYLFLQGLFNALTFAVYTSLYAVFLVQRQGYRVKTLLEAIVVGAIPALLCLGMQGRPEQLAPLILALPLLAFAGLRSPSQISVISGITLGLLSLLSPLVGVVFFLILTGLVYVCSGGQWKRVFTAISISVLVAIILGYVIVAAMTPFDPIGWVHTVLQAGSSAHNFKGGLINPKNSLAGSVGAPGWNLIVLFLLTLGLAAVSRAHRYGVLLLLPLMAASLLLTDKMADYSYLSFFPFAFGVMLAAPASPRQSPSNQHTQQKRYRLRKRIALAIGLVYGSLLLLYFYLSMANPFAQLSLQQSQATFRQTVAGKDLFSREHVVGFPALGWPSLVALGESGANLIALTPYAQPNTETFLAEYEARTHQSMRYFILQPLSERTKSGLAPFPPKDLYLGKVRFNLYQQNPANDPGFEQGQTPTSFVFTNPYTYSIYRRVDSPLPQS